MSIQLRLRILLGALFAAVLVVSIGAALQFRELAMLAAQPDTAELVAARSTTAAIGLTVLGVLGLAVGASAFRSLRRGFLRRLTDLDQAAQDIQQGDDARRVPIDSDDELARIGRALNFALDLRERGEAAIRGRNREIRAVLVALLRQWQRPVAITGIDGEVVASTLSPDDEARLRTLTPQVRKAASVLLSRGFASAAELATDVSFAEGGVVHIRALALGEQRIVGWLAEFEPGSRQGEHQDHDGPERDQQRDDAEQPRPALGDPELPALQQPGHTLVANDRVDQHDRAVGHQHEAGELDQQRGALD